MRKSFAVFLAVFMLFAGVAARAADDVPVPPALQQLEKDGGTVEFIGHAYGTDGWRITNKAGDHKYAYTTPEGGLLLGILLRPDGTSETNAQLVALKQQREGGQQAAPGAEQAKADSAKSERLYAEVEKSGWVAVGSQNAPYIYLFLNTLCDHCQGYWKELQEPLAAGKLQVRLVPFGKQEENRQSGAALLSVPDPGRAWDAFIGGDKEALSEKKIKPGMLERIDANTALFRDWKMGAAPPVTIYRKPGDGQITAIVGAPANTMLVLADMLKAN